MPAPSDKELAAIEQYLKAFARCLAPLPRDDRNEIVREARSHLVDSISDGASAGDATAALGEPSRYARRFVDSYSMDVALASNSAIRMLLTAGSFIGRSIGAFIGFHVLLLLFSMAVALLLMALVKPFAPEYVGLWSSDDGITFGLILSPDPMSIERLGWWIVPLGLLGSGLLVIVTRRLLKAFLNVLRAGALADY